MAENNFKREKLTEALGDFKDWQSLGWVFNTEDNHWSPIWKHELYSREYIAQLELDGKLPPFRTHCDCTTKIKRNVLIRHISSERFDFVGSECMKYFGMHLRKCIKCHERNLCRTNHCAKCRRKCWLHDTYHDDNAVHEREMIPVKDEDEPLGFEGDAIVYQERMARIKAERFKVLSFGKHLGKNVDDLLGVDDGYIQFLARELNAKPQLCDYIRTELLAKTKIQFGKYRQDKPFEWIKTNDPPYWQWLTTKCSLPICAILSGLII